VAFDGTGVLYVRNLPVVQELIRVHAPRGLRPGDPGQPFEPTRLSQAEADIEAAMASDPNLGVLYLYAAQLWLAKDEPARARQSLEAGLRADPDFAPQLFSPGRPCASRRVWLKGRGQPCSGAKAWA